MQSFSMPNNDLNSIEITLILSSVEISTFVSKFLIIEIPLIYGKDFNVVSILKKGAK